MNQIIDSLPAESISADALRDLGQILNDSEAPKLVGREGFEVELPEPVFHLLLSVFRHIQRGESVSLIPTHEEVSTQVAAEILGVSRPHVVKLLTTGEIPFRLAGRHRRVRLDDLEKFRASRHVARRKVLDSVFDAIEADGLSANLG